MGTALLYSRSGATNHSNTPVQRRNIATGELITVPPGTTSAFSQAERDKLNEMGAAGGGNLLTGANGILKNPVTAIAGGVATAGLADVALAGLGGEAAGAGATAAAAAPLMPPAIVDTAALTAGAAGAGAAAGATLMPPAVADTAVLGAPAAAGTAAAVPAAAEATGAPIEPGAPATPQMPPAQPEVGAPPAAKTTLGTIKELAPAVNAGLTALGLGATLAAGTPGDMGSMEAPTPPDLPVEADVQKQNAIDPDLTAIRKKNALLFGLDSPSNTDLTKGNASTGNLGRVTLLGGTSSLG